MVRVLIFIALKIAEVAGLVLVYLAFAGIGHLVAFVSNAGIYHSCWYHFEYFLFGSMSSLFASLIVFLGVQAITSNWSTAGRLCESLKSRRKA